MGHTQVDFVPIPASDITELLATGLPRGSEVFDMELANIQVVPYETDFSTNFSLTNCRASK